MKKDDLSKAAVGNLHIREEAAFEFFVVYARYEYAAKVCRLVHQGDHVRELAVNPQAVADRIREKFNRCLATDLELQDAVNYYRKKPPQKQVWNGKEPAWQAPVYQGSDDLKILLLQLAQARNNLFHGGKGWKADTYDIDRDNDLLRHGLTILGAILKADDELYHEFSSFS